MTLEVEIHARNMDNTQKINDYVTKKVSKLDHYLSGIEEARVDVSYVKSARSAADRHVAQITVSGKGFILRAEERADDIITALDVAVDKIQRRIARYKGKRDKGRGDGRSAADIATELYRQSLDEEETGELEPVIVRRKHFLMTPMDELEAIEQMNLLGHENFFVFFNAHSTSINVLYKRRDGQYGLIEPELG